MPGAGFPWGWGHSCLTSRDQRPGQIFRNAFFWGTGKARPAGTSPVEQLERNTSPGIAGSKMRSRTGLLHDLARCGSQRWSLHCLQHHLLSQSCGSASPLARSPERCHTGGGLGGLPSAQWCRMSSPHCPMSAASHCPGIWLHPLGEAPTPATGIDGGWDRQH